MLQGFDGGNSFSSVCFSHSQCARQITVAPFFGFLLAAVLYKPDPEWW